MKAAAIAALQRLGFEPAKYSKVADFQRGPLGIVVHHDGSWTVATILPPPERTWPVCR